MMLLACEDPVRLSALAVNGWNGETIAARAAKPRRLPANSGCHRDKICSPEYFHNPQNQTERFYCNLKKSSFSRPSLSCVMEIDVIVDVRRWQNFCDQRLSLSEPRWDPLHPQLTGLTTKLTCKIEVWLTVFSMDDVPI